MSDPYVSLAQSLVNRYAATVSNIPTVEVNGKTGWSVIYGLRRCLQHVLGVDTAKLSNSFTSELIQKLSDKYPSTFDSSNDDPRVTELVKAALYCTGYAAGGIDFIYGDALETAFSSLKRRIGLEDPRQGIPPKLFQAIFTMDAYVLLPGGDQRVQEIQRWLNGSYFHRPRFPISPCDGIYSRQTLKALLFAIQFELGMTDDVANGAFGPATQSGLRQKTLTSGSSGIWVQILTAALVFNRRDNIDWGATYGHQVYETVRVFQQHCKLPVTGTVDFSTWASLLVSCGDTSRKGEACDCSTQVTQARAITLRDAGVKVVGRYLCNTPSSDFNKMIQPGELSVITQSGLRVFPIYQTAGNVLSYFDELQGLADGASADRWARYHGFKLGTTVYFAVDFDVLEGNIRSSIFKYFQGVVRAVAAAGGRYRVGVYAPRNVCILLASHGLTTASFVSGMSYGFSANMGYPLPDDWSFDQISTINLGSGAGAIQVDNNILSGTDMGQDSFDVSTAPPLKNEVPFKTQYKGARLNELVATFDALENRQDPSSVGAPYSIADVNDMIQQLDEAITAIANTLGMRKAAIQATIAYESRTTTVEDMAVDIAVRECHLGVAPCVVDDSSTGIGQIYARTAMPAFNTCVGMGLAPGPLLDSIHDKGAVWLSLNSSKEYSVRMIAYVHVYSSVLLRMSRISFATTQSEWQALFTKYNGAGHYGRDLVKLYVAFEKYNALSRGE